MADLRAKKKRWLSRYRRLVDEVYSLECLEKERYTLLTEASANVIDGMPKSPQFNNRSDFMLVKHLEVGEDLKELQKRADEVRREISCSINRLEDSNQAQILRYKYLNGFSWLEIQGKMHYSLGGLYNLLNKAVDHLVIPVCEN